MYSFRIKELSFRIPTLLKKKKRSSCSKISDDFDTLLKTQTNSNQSYTANITTTKKYDKLEQIIKSILFKVTKKYKVRIKLPWHPKPTKSQNSSSNGIKSIQV